MQQKRRRGRPPGTGIDDKAALEAIAALVVTGKTVVQAINLVCVGDITRNAAPASVKRRLRAKWTNHGHLLLESARRLARPPVVIKRDINEVGRRPYVGGAEMLRQTFDRLNPLASLLARSQPFRAQIPVHAVDLMRVGDIQTASSTMEALQRTLQARY